MTTGRINQVAANRTGQDEPTQSRPNTPGRQSPRSLFFHRRLQRVETSSPLFPFHLTQCLPQSNRTAREVEHPAAVACQRPLSARSTLAPPEPGKRSGDRRLPSPDQQLRVLFGFIRMPYRYKLHAFALRHRRVHSQSFERPPRSPGRFADSIWSFDLSKPGDTDRDHPSPMEAPTCALLNAPPITDSGVTSGRVRALAYSPEDLCKIFQSVPAPRSRLSARPRLSFSLSHSIGGFIFEIRKIQPPSPSS